MWVASLAGRAERRMGKTIWREFGGDHLRRGLQQKTQGEAADPRPRKRLQRQAFLVFFSFEWASGGPVNAPSV